MTAPYHSAVLRLRHPSLSGRFFLSLGGCSRGAANSAILIFRFLALEEGKTCVLHLGVFAASQSIYT